MGIYYIYIIYCLISSFCYRASKLPKNKRRLILSFFLWLGLFLIMALRADSVGNDLIRYIEHYKNAKYISGFTTSTEFGYVVFQKILYFLGISARGYIVVVSFIISTSFSWFFYKYSRNITFSFLLYLTIGLFSFTMTGIRQSLAISFTIYALHFAITRRLFLFILLTLLASTFHRSALIFFPVYLILRISFNSYKPIILCVFLLAVSIFINQYLFSYLGYISGDVMSLDYQSYLEASDKSTMNPLLVIFKFLLPISIILFWILQKKKIYQIGHVDVSFFILSLISTVFTILSLNLSIINRLSLYFSTYILVLIPNTIKNFKNQSTRDIFQFIILIISIAFFMVATTGGITKIDDYSFFWH